MERRQFLIGASTILTSAYVARAEWFLEKEKAVVPLIKDTTHTPVIYVVKNDFDYELRLNSRYMDYPEDLTCRQALEEYYGIWYSEDERVKLSEYKERC